MLESAPKGITTDDPQSHPSWNHSGSVFLRKHLMLNVLLKFLVFSIFKDPEFLHFFFLVSCTISPCKLSTLFISVCVHVCAPLQKAVKTHPCYTITHYMTLLTALFSYFSCREASLVCRHNSCSKILKLTV